MIFGLLFEFLPSSGLVCMPPGEQDRLRANVGMMLKSHVRSIGCHVDSCADIFTSDFAMGAGFRGQGIAIDKGLSSF